LKGTFYIDHKTIIQDSDRPREHCFEVLTPTRVYYFSVEDEDSKIEWKEAFKLAVLYNKIDWDPVAVAAEISSEVVSASKHEENDQIVQRFVQKNLLLPIDADKTFQVENQQITTSDTWKMTLETLLDNVERHQQCRDFVVQCLHVASQALLALNPSILLFQCILKCFSFVAS
jgi:sulfur carrier protein ThiS